MHEITVYKLNKSMIQVNMSSNWIIYSKVTLQLRTLIQMAIFEKKREKKNVPGEPVTIIRRSQLTTLVNVFCYIFLRSIILLRRFDTV